MLFPICKTREENVSSTFGGLAPGLYKENLQWVSTGEKIHKLVMCVGHSQQNKGTQQIQTDLGAVAIFIEKKRQENRQHRKSK